MKYPSINVGDAAERLDRGAVRRRAVECTEGRDGRTVGRRSWTSGHLPWRTLQASDRDVVSTSQASVGGRRWLMTSNSLGAITSDTRDVGRRNAEKTTCGPMDGQRPAAVSHWLSTWVVASVLELVCVYVVRLPIGCCLSPEKQTNGRYRWTVI